MTVDFESVWSKAREVAGVAGQKTNELVEFSKLKVSILQLTSELGELYKKLGSIYYQQKHNGKTTDEAELLELITSINETHAAIAENETRLSELRKAVKCPVCGTENKQDANFCMGCGAKMENAEKSESANAEKCPICGAVVPHHAKFCSACGCKFEEGKKK